MALRTACVNPDTLQPYIKSLTGGKDNSPEGLQVGFEKEHKYLSHYGHDMLTGEACHSKVQLMDL